MNCDTIKEELAARYTLCHALLCHRFTSKARRITVDESALSRGTPADHSLELSPCNNEPGLIKPEAGKESSA